MRHQLDGENIITLALAPEVNGRVLAARAHITHCRECAEALATFVNEQLLAESEQQTLWSWTEAGALLIQFTRKAIEAFQSGPRLTTGFVFRHSGSELVYHYQLAAEPAGFEVEVKVERQGDEDTCTVLVTVIQPGEQIVLKQVRTKVTLSWGEDIPQTAETDALGEAVFEDVPLEALTSLMIEIEPLSH